MTDQDAERTYRNGPYSTISEQYPYHIAVDKYESIELTYKDRRYRIVQHENGIQLERVKNDE